MQQLLLAQLIQEEQSIFKIHFREKVKECRYIVIFCIEHIFSYLFVNHSVKKSLEMKTKDTALNPLKSGELYFICNLQKFMFNATTKLTVKGTGIFYEHKYFLVIGTLLFYPHGPNFPCSIFFGNDYIYKCILFYTINIISLLFPLILRQQSRMIKRTNISEFQSYFHCTTELGIFCISDITLLIVFATQIY